MDTHVRERADALWEAVIAHYGYQREELIGPGRTAPVVEARQMLMTLLYHYAGLTLTEVGRDTKRDHTTVLHAVTVIGRRLRADPEAPLHGTVRAIVAACPRWAVPEKARDEWGVRALIERAQRTPSGVVGYAAVPRVPAVAAAAPRAPEPCRVDILEARYWKATMRRQREREALAWRAS